MIFGNVAYRGSLSRRSVVTTAGSMTLTVSKPPSISRVTVRPSSVFSNLDANVAYKNIWQQLANFNYKCSNQTKSKICVVLMLNKLKLEFNLTLFNMVLILYATLVPPN